jgi:hypothetical protein
MEELSQINNIINQGIQNSSYVSVIISSCVFIIYTLIIRLVDFFKTKHKDKPLFEMSKTMQEMGANIIKLNSILNKTFDNVERKQIIQCDKTIQLGFKTLAFKIIQECFDIIIHNNIDKNKELITNNLIKVISTEYHKLYHTLSLYEVKNINVASTLKQEWINELSDTVIGIIYNGQEPISRISHINDRLTILVNDYAIYVTNKTINT